MSAKIYSGIEGIELPELNFDNISAYNKATEKYMDELKAVCKANSNHKDVGEVIKFGVADGYALYMVYSMEPLELIHIGIMDGYQFEYVDLMTPERVSEQIEKNRRIAELFSKKL